MATITYSNASCIYAGSDKLAVDSLNLDIADGEFVVLVGPSGSGKSTALRMLAGLEDIDEGNIEIGGKDMVGVPSKDRDIAMVFQNYALYPTKTVAENMGFALKLRGVSADERRKKVEEAAKLLDLSEFLDRKPAKLSGGQRQRVAMGRAIVRNPQVFCMDEPLSNLDAKLRVQTRTQIAALQRRLGTTTVYVTHDQVEAMTMGDRVAVLRRRQTAAIRLAHRALQQTRQRVRGRVHRLTGDEPYDGADHQRRRQDRRGLHAGTRTRSADPAARRRPGPRHRRRATRRTSTLSESGGIEMVIDLVEDLGSETYIYTHAHPDVDLVARSLSRAREAGRHGRAAQAPRRRGAPVQPRHRRTHRLGLVEFCTRAVLFAGSRPWCRFRRLGRACRHAQPVASFTSARCRDEVYMKLGSPGAACSARRWILR